MMEMVLTNARVVLADQTFSGSVHVRDGMIVSIDSGSTSVKGAFDLQGNYLMPGFVEIHTDNFERHLMPRPKVTWAEMPALLAHDAEVIAAGITTVFDALGVGDADPDSLRGSTWRTVVETLDTCLAQDLLRADHHLHVRCELPAPNTIDLFAPFDGHPRLSLISLMDHTPGQRQWENIDVARVYYTGKKGWSSEKFERQVAMSTQLQDRYAAPHRAWFVDYCRRHHVALASHDDTTADHVKQAHTEGASMSEFPTTLLAAQVAHDLGMLNVMGGPNVVRGGSHSGNVAATQLARKGLLDILSSDYVPGSLLSAVVRLVDEGLMTWAQAVATVSLNPAKATGLNDRGSIDAGKRADLIQVKLVDLPNGLHHAVVRSVWRTGQRMI